MREVYSWRPCPSSEDVSWCFQPHSRSDRCFNSSDSSFFKKNYLFGCIRSQLGHVGSSLQCRFSSCDVPLACGILAPVERWGSPPLILLKTVIFFKNWKAWDLQNSKWFSGSHAFRSILQTLGKQIVAKALKDFGPCISQDNTSDSELLSAP